jgi:hypothetical protein
MGTIMMDLKELIDEHERLVGLLATTIDNLLGEYSRQVKELDSYKEQYKAMGAGISDDKIGYVMREFKNGRLIDRSGRLVTNPKQAIAIAISESRRRSRASTR